MKNTFVAIFMFLGFPLFLNATQSLVSPSMKQVPGEPDSSGYSVYHDYKQIKGTNFYQIEVNLEFVSRRSRNVHSAYFNPAKGTITRTGDTLFWNVDSKKIPIATTKWWWYPLWQDLKNAHVSPYSKVDPDSFYYDVSASLNAEMPKAK